MPQAKATAQAIKAITENQASEIMWIFYRDHKSALISNTSEYRDFIMAELVKGYPAGEVFARFMQSSDLPAASSLSKR